MREEGNEQGTTPSMEEPLPPPQEPISSSPKQIYELVTRIISTDDSFGNMIQEASRTMHFFDPLINTKADENILILRIAFLEEPLTAQTLSTIISAITDLHARCWFIQQNRLADLMDYAQSRDPRYLKEVNLRIGTLSHNSPAIIDFLISSVGGIAGAATLALALKKGIDAIVQTPLRFEETKLKNEREKLNQKIVAEKAEAEKRTRDKEQEIAAKNAQVELEEKQLKLDRQKLQFQQDRVKITLEIATMVVSELQSVSDAGQREMIIHSLVPSFLQIAATETVLVTQLIGPKDEENKPSSESK